MSVLLEAAPIARPVAKLRDTSIDTMRAILLAMVVLLHAMMVGVSIDSDGVPVMENAMDGYGPFAVATWVMQMMPLFFVLGGFASWTQYSRESAKGLKASTYVVARLRRLLLPSAIAIGAVAVFLGVLTLSGASEQVVASAGFRMSQPLWFLGVYLGATALVPCMSACHKRAPLFTLGALAAGVISVDLIRTTTGIEAIGLINMSFVWLLMQQLGFMLADGTLDRIAPRVRAAIGVAAAIVLLGGVLTGVYPADLYMALNPPQGALVLLGVVHVSIFMALRPALRRLEQRRAVRPLVGWINARSMTIYVWHMPAIIALAGALLLSPGTLPAPLSGDWWASRPVWLLFVFALVALVTMLVGKTETARSMGWVPASALRATLLTLAAIGAVLFVLALGAQPATWSVSAGVLICCIVLTTARMRAPRATAEATDVQIA